MATKSINLTTGDPAFDPQEPVTVNGYRFEPAATPLGRPPSRYVAPPRPAFAAGYEAPACRVRQEGDEFVCVSCARRWGVDEERPDCATEQGRVTP